MIEGVNYDEAIRDLKTLKETHVEGRGEMLAEVQRKRAESSGIGFDEWLRRAGRKAACTLCLHR